MTAHRPVALTADAFQDFGEVAVARSGTGLQAVLGALEADDKAVRPVLFLLNLRPTPDYPFPVARLERHPHAAQTFLPLRSDVGLVIVCRSSSDGRPALDTLRAFITSPGQVVTYRRGVWHHSAMGYKEAAAVAMTMVHAPDAPDTEFFDVPAGSEIRIV
jgi:ureidoglycolate lyase